MPHNCENEIDMTKQQTCDHCGSKRVISFRNGCPMCSAPICCQDCCEQPTKEVREEWEEIDKLWEEYHFFKEDNRTGYINLFNDFRQLLLTTREETADRISKLEQIRCDEMVKEATALAREEERQFILNVLDGIDIADEQMQNKGGGTRAIRHALQSRPIR